MRRLFWKEWRERRWWLLAWTLAVVGTAALGKGQPFLGSTTSVTFWAMLPIAFALLAGLGAYGSELHGERVAFLYTRPLSWKQVLTAKILLGLATALLAPLLGAVVLHFVVPVEFLTLATPAHLALGALQFAGIMGAAFLIGLGCSVALPGIAGSILILLCWVGAFLAGGYLIIDRTYWDTSDTLIQLALPCPLIAAIILARFGVTLNPGARMKRYLALVLTAVLLSTLLTFLPPVRDLLDWDDAEQSIDTNVVISPTSAFVLVICPPRQHEIGKMKWGGAYWLHRTTGEARYIGDKLERSMEYRWIGNSCAVHNIQTMKYVNDNKWQSTVTFTWWDDGQVRSSQLIREDNSGFHDYRFLMSPDEQRVLISVPTRLEIFTLRTRKRQVIVQLEERVRRNHRLDASGDPLSHCWWQSDNEVGYLDPMSGQRVLVRVQE